MQYFENERKASSVLGTIELKGATVERLSTKESDGINGFRFGITPKEKTRMYKLQCKRLDQRENWIKYAVRFGAEMRSLPEHPQNVVSGYLQKRGVVNTKWRRRYFSCSDGTISYYLDERQKTKLGSFEVDDALVAVLLPIEAKAIGREGRVFTITPKDSARTFMLEAENEYDLRTWLKCLPPPQETPVDVLIKQYQRLEHCLRSVIMRRALMFYAAQQHCQENLRFVEEVESLLNHPPVTNRALGTATTRLMQIYVRPGAPEDIGANPRHVAKMMRVLDKGKLLSVQPFARLQQEAMEQVRRGIFPRFLQTQEFQLAVLKLARGGEHQSLMSSAALERDPLKGFSSVHLSLSSAHISTYQDENLAHLLSSYSLKQAKVFVNGNIQTTLFGIDFGDVRIEYKISSPATHSNWISAFSNLGTATIILTTRRLNMRAHR